MNRTEKLIERKKTAEIQKELERKEFIADIKKKSDICKKFVNDKRHIEFKSLIDIAIKYKQEQYENLGDSVKSMEEFNRLGLILSTEIKTLKWILHTPDKFVGIEDRIKGENK